MGQPIKCKLLLHGSFKQFDMGEFKSISAAKKYVTECWDRPYTIIPLRKKTSKTVKTVKI